MQDALNTVELITAAGVCRCVRRPSSMSGQLFIPARPHGLSRNELRRLTTRLLIFLGLWVMVCLTPLVAAEDLHEKGYLLKAVFIYNFAKLTRWPEDVWGNDGVPLTLCTAGKDAVVGALTWLRGKRVKGHEVEVVTLEQGQARGGCHVLYIAASEQAHLSEALLAVEGQPVLTISEIGDFLDHGGGIELLRDADRIRFKINLDATQQAGLELSSRLLNLAVVVRHEAS